MTYNFRSKGFGLAALIMVSFPSHSHAVGIFEQMAESLHRLNRARDAFGQRGAAGEQRAGEEQRDARRREKEEARQRRAQLMAAGLMTPICKRRRARTLIAPNAPLRGLRTVKIDTFNPNETVEAIQLQTTPRRLLFNDSDVQSAPHAESDFHTELAPREHVDYLTEFDNLQTEYAVVTSVAAMEALSLANNGRPHTNTELYLASIKQRMLVIVGVYPHLRDQMSFQARS